METWSYKIDVCSLWSRKNNGDSLWLMETMKANSSWSMDYLEVTPHGTYENTGDNSFIFCKNTVG